jgi:hypothetical protein
MYGVSGMVRRRAIVGALALAIVVAAMATWRSPARPYESLWPGVANLRAQFNADAGKVRILLLPAPT